MPSGHGGTHQGRLVLHRLLAAISPEALKAKSAELRAMRIRRRTDLTLADWHAG
jgi:hypothetical protein